MQIRVNDVVRKNLSDNEYKYLRLLEFHKDFVKGVKSIRNKLGIKVKEDDETIADLKPPNERELVKETFNLVQKIGIPFTLTGCIESIIKWGQVLMATKPIIVLSPEYQLNRKSLYSEKVRPKGRANTNRKKLQSMIEEGWYKHNQSLAKKYDPDPFVPVILIAKPVKKTELIEAIEKGWEEEIEPAIKDYVRSLPYPVEIDRVPVNEVEGYIELLRLRLDGKTHQEIADILHLEHDSVREKYSKIKRFFNKIGFPTLKV